MNTIGKILSVCLCVVCLAISCENEEPDPQPQSFEATFFTTLVSILPDSVNCSAPYTFLNTQEGNGTASLIGSFTTRMTFCVNPATFEYVDTEGSFVGANGDEIFFTGGGQVVPTQEPGYDLEFKDPFTITGGMGRFLGATGTMTTNSYVNQTTGQTDHVWTGTITLGK